MPRQSQLVEVPCIQCGEKRECLIRTPWDFKQAAKVRCPKCANNAQKTVRTARMKATLRARFATGPQPCRHCKSRNAIKPSRRGLCWGCYNQPDVKSLYPPSPSCLIVGLGTGNNTSALPTSPTDAPVGSADKMRVMTERAMRGESLFHPDDNPAIVSELLRPFDGEHRGAGELTGLEEVA
jgi:hypothetical protein